jgi:glycosyltransferase involved in cell wall biosynthesis
MARWSRLCAPVRVVLDTLHSSSTGTLGRWLGYRWSDWLADRVTAVSVAVSDAHVSAGMASKQKLLVIPNGVGVETWRPNVDVRQTLRQGLEVGGEFLWFAAGRLEPVKDYPTLLRAFSGLAEPAELVIAGTGPLKAELVQLATELGVSRRVRFLGFEPDVRRWMQAADGFVLTSRWEGLPMALLEAAACARPAVATDVPGTREVVVDGQTGLLAEAGDANKLCEAMTSMMHMTREDRMAMGERARQRAIECFSLETMLDKYEALYRRLIAANPGPRRWARSN